MDQIFLAIAAIIIISTIFASLAKFLKQPLIISYILTGIVLKLFFPVFLTSNFAMLGDFGIAFLLFIVGLELNPKFLREIGLVSITTGLIQIAVSFSVSYGLAKFLGFPIIEAIIIGMGLSFSSTIIVVKLFTDNNQIGKFYSRVATGILILQDIAAIFVLVLLSNLSSIGTNVANILVMNFIKGSIFLCSLVLIYMTVLPKMLDFFAKSQELLFLFTLSWCFLWSSLAYYLGFSIEIGALLSGISLSNLPFHYDMETKVARIRDFFLILFFVTLGAGFNITNFQFDTRFFYQIGLFLFVPLIVNPIMIFIVLNRFGITFKNAVMTALCFSQISEFAFIILNLAIKEKLISNTYITQLFTIGALITMTLSSYMISYNERLLNTHALRRFGSMFHMNVLQKNLKSFKQDKKDEYEYVLFGYNGTTQQLLKNFKGSLKKKILIVDNNPRTVRKLNEKKIACVYADAEDADVLDKVIPKKVRLAVCTVNNLITNTNIIRYFKHHKNKPLIIATAYTASEAVDLYDLGANYVIVPHFIANSFVSDIIHDAESNVKIHKNIKKYKKQQMRHLKG